MIDALNNFADRRSEVDLYFRFLEDVENDSVAVEAIPLHSDLKKMLKANAFLILYNLVEATVRDGIRAIYTSIKTDGLCYADVSTQLRKLWIDAEYARQMGDRVPNHDTYARIAWSIVDEVIMRPVVTFWSDFDAGIGGNLDARRIREVAKRYGFSIRPSKQARGGTRLLVVKQRRNDLAHGIQSFIDCGRDQVVSDLIAIKNEAIVYLNDLLSAIGTYITGKHYAASPPVS